MDEKQYYVSLCEYHSDRTLTDSHRMTYEEAKKVKEYFESVFTSYDVYVRINVAY